MSFNFSHFLGRGAARRLDDATPEKPEEEVGFSIENAEFLLSASEAFDRFINATVNDLDSFR